MLEDKEPIPYKPITGSSHIWVETLEDLNAMCEKLENTNEIAIDLEVEVLSINSLLLINCFANTDFLSCFSITIIVHIKGLLV
jgi:hypothetical protein